MNPVFYFIAGRLLEVAIIISIIGLIFTEVYYHYKNKNKNKNK